MNDPLQIHPDDAAFGRILSNHLVRYPLMQMSDLYKLIHQAAMGSEHAVSDVGSVQAWLDREIQDLGPGPADPLLDLISGDGRIVRVHLRPYVQTHSDLMLLLQAFVRTANHHRGDTAHLKAYLALAEEMASAGWLPFAQRELAGFFADLAGRGYPAVHHSTAYKTAYHPAYRVVAREFLRL